MFYGVKSDVTVRTGCSSHFDNKYVNITICHPFFPVFFICLPTAQNTTLHVFKSTYSINCQGIQPTIWSVLTHICAKTQTLVLAIVGAPTDLKAHLYTCQRRCAVHDTHIFSHFIVYTHVVASSADEYCTVYKGP